MSDLTDNLTADSSSVNKTYVQVERMTAPQTRELIETILDRYYKERHVRLLRENINIRILKELNIQNDKGQWWDIENFLISNRHIPTSTEHSQNKVVKDPVHGPVLLHSACVAIMDTPQFQRLRSISQTGTCSLVYPGATHTRFEHSIGVSHMAGQFIRFIKNNRPFLGINAVDILCVEIAGLCCNLGYGPYSDVFGEVFSEFSEVDQISVEMFDYMVRENNLICEFEKYGIKNEDVTFIREIIRKPQVTAGRDDDYAFLYQIVSNRVNMLDVKNWDRCARDCYHMGLNEMFDFTRIMMFASVAKVDGKMQLCLRDKEVANLNTMFLTQHRLHRNVYNHKVKLGADIMIKEALFGARSFFKFKYDQTIERRISKCEENLREFTALNDMVLFQILHSAETDLNASKEIISKFYNRKLAKCAFEKEFRDFSFFEQIEDSELLLDIRKRMEAGVPRMDVQEVENYMSKIKIKKTILDFGFTDNNNIEEITVFSRDRTPLGKRLAINQNGKSEILGPTERKIYLLGIYVFFFDAEDMCATINGAATQYFEKLQST